MGQNMTMMRTGIMGLPLGISWQFEGPVQAMVEAQPLQRIRAPRYDCGIIILGFSDQDLGFWSDAEAWDRYRQEMPSVN